MTDKRAIDNTLPQTAYAYFKNPEDPFLEVNARDSFMEFVNAFINAPKPVVPVPGKTTHLFEIEEPFIELWQSKAEIYPGDTKSSDEPDEELLNRFINTLDDKLRRLSWSSWIRFQWTKEIVAGYKSRVENWEKDFNDALLAIHKFQQDGPDPLKTSGGVEKLKKQIRKDFEILSLDRDYSRFAIKNGVKIEEVAVAYAFSWFKRGAKYIDRVGESKILFHVLRVSAGESPSDTTSFQNGPEELEKWGEILDKFLNYKLISRDKEHIKDILYLMRDTVQNDGEYRYNIEKMIAETNSLKKELFEDQAISRVLFRAGMPPEYTSSYNRIRLNRALEEFKKQAREQGTTFLYAPFRYEIIDRTPNFEKIENDDTGVAGERPHWKLYKR